MSKQKLYVRGHYRTIYTNKPIWLWREHLKLAAIPVLLFVLFWQLNIAAGNAKDMLNQYIVVKAENSRPLVSPLPVLLTTTPRPATTPVPSHISWNEFVKKVKDLAPIYDFPANVALAQAALESNRGTSKYALERNNYFGYGAVDWNPDNATYFDNPDQGIIAYMLLIKNKFPQAYAARKNPEQMAKLLENNADGIKYASDPSYVIKLVNTPEWSEQ